MKIQIVSGFLGAGKTLAGMPTIVNICGKMTAVYREVAKIAVQEEYERIFRDALSFPVKGEEK